MESIARPVQPAARPSLALERRAAPPVPPSSSTRPQKEQALNCPRCNSSNTKFCYYNNYSLSQPRYFCKTCRRYWTEGGSLRNVPIGGGSRKNRRSPSSSSSSSTSSPNTTPLSSSSNYTNDNRNSNLMSCPPQTFPPIVPLPPHHQHQIIMNPRKIMVHAAGQDLNLTYPPPLHPPSSGAENYDDVPRHIPNLSLSAMELLKINSFPVSESSCCGGGLYSASGFSRVEYKPALNFPVGGFESGRGGYGVEESSASGAGGGCRLLFPLEDSKPRERMSSEVAETHHGNRDHNSSTTNTAADHGYWNGMLGTGGGSW